MTYKSDPIAEKLDKLVEKTGFPEIQRRYEARGYGNRAPLRFRTVPLLLLALASAGMALQIFFPWGYGLWLIMGAWFVTNFVFQLGPLTARRGKWDEREAAVVRHGHFVGLMVGFVIAVLGSLTVAFGQIGAMLRLWDYWAPRNGLDWVAVAFFLLVVELNVAVLAASSATPEPLEDEED